MPTGPHHSSITAPRTIWTPPRQWVQRWKPYSRCKPNSRDGVNPSSTLQFINTSQTSKCRCVDDWLCPHATFALMGLSPLPGFQDLPLLDFSLIHITHKRTIDISILFHKSRPTILPLGNQSSRSPQVLRIVSVRQQFHRTSSKSIRSGLN